MRRIAVKNGRPGKGRIVEYPSVTHTKNYRNIANFCSLLSAVCDVCYSSKICFQYMFERQFPFFFLRSIVLFHAFFELYNKLSETFFWIFLFFSFFFSRILFPQENSNNSSFFSFSQTTKNLPFPPPFSHFPLPGSTERFVEEMKKNSS